MAELIAIVGESGHGKSHSIQFLDHNSTFLFNADKKSLPFSWKNKYSVEKGNYCATSDVDLIMKGLKAIEKDEKFSHIKVVVIDTMNRIMVDDEMKRMREKNYDKWIDLATSIYGIINYCSTMRDDLIVICMFHVQDLVDEVGNHFYRIQTSGRKLEKIKLETMFSIVLFCECEYGDEINVYKFNTQAKFSTAKSPIGMFKERYIPNNLKLVVDCVNSYYTSEHKQKGE